MEIDCKNNPIGVGKQYYLYTTCKIIFVTFGQYNTSEINRTLSILKAMVRCIM